MTAMGRGSLAGRALDYFSFYCSAFLVLARILNQNDIVVAKTDPPLISVVAAFAALLRGARLVPGAQLRVVPNWADGAGILPQASGASALRREWGLEGKFVVGYSGNLGRVHDCETVLAAARLLVEERDLVFSFVGGGYHFPRLRAAGLANVSVPGYVPEDRLGESLGTCDLHLVTLLPAFEQACGIEISFHQSLGGGRCVPFARAMSSSSEASSAATPSAVHAMSAAAMARMRPTPR